MKVLTFICDGAAQNRRFFKLHKMADGSNVSTDGVVYWCKNRYDPTRKIYFFSDPPHLMKTLRNNIERSNGTTGTRNLIVRLSIANLTSFYSDSPLMISVYLDIFCFSQTGFHFTYYNIHYFFLLLFIVTFFFNFSRSMVTR